MGAEIIGIRELSQAFKQLNQDVSRKVGLRMAASAASVIKTQVKNNIRSAGLIQSKSLLNNVAIKREKKVSSGVIQYHVGIRHGRTRTKKQRANNKAIKITRNGTVKVVRANDPFYWRFLEFGTRKGIKPRNFVSKALEQKKNEAIAAMQRVIERDILKGR